MEENLILEWGKNYIKIENGMMSVKNKGNFVMNGVLGGSSSGEVICDKIKNFSLLCFDSYMKFDINVILKHIPSGTIYRIEIAARKKESEKWYKFKDIMQINGVFENKKRTEVFYEKQINKREEQKDFYEKLKKLPGFYSFFTKKEIGYLKQILFEDEEVFAATSGIMDGNTWLIVCTTKRIIFIDKGMLYGVKHSEIMINRVNAISFKNGIMLGEIHVEDGASTRIIKNVDKNSTKPFVDAVHKTMEIQNRNRNTVTQQATSNADELLKFKNLFDMRVITQEEFDRQKKKLLE